MTARRWLLLLVSFPLAGCGGRAYEQSYVRAPDNWQFRRAYPEADGLLNAFDYGHAILSETLLDDRARAGTTLDGSVFQRLRCGVLLHPPGVPLEEHAIASRWGVAFPEALETFRWAHMLHRHLYDILSDPSLSASRRETRIAAEMRYYRSRPDLALSSQPKSMGLMEGQPYSLAFRRLAPRYNGLIWSYHWLQMSLYDALLMPGSEQGRHTAVRAAIARFMEMSESDGGMPKAMPMSLVSAPRFSAAYPDAAIIFDNLHSLHDVVSDILSTNTLTLSAKQDAIRVALARYRDDSSYVSSRAEWAEMSKMMDQGPLPGSQSSVTGRCR